MIRPQSPFKLYCKGYKKRKECSKCPYWVRGTSLRLIKNDGYKMLNPPPIKPYSKCRIKFMCNFKSCDK